MKRYTEERVFVQKACTAFIALSVITATLGFWAKGPLPAALLTAAMLIVVFLLSYAVERVQEAWQTKNYFTAIVAGVMAGGFALMEANLNHIGLAHLNAEYDIIPTGNINLLVAQIDTVWAGSFFISLVNVWASYSYARQLEDKRQPLNPGKLLVAMREQKKRAA